MTLHYHGTPITPRKVLEQLAGACFCVSFAEPRDVERVHQIGQSVMLDNGAFSLSAAFRLNLSMIHPAKNPQPNGFDLATFAPSLDGDAGEALGEFLSRFEDPMPEPVISVPWSDETQTMLDWNKVKVDGELATDLLAERNRYRAALEQSTVLLEDVGRAFTNNWAMDWGRVETQAEANRRELAR